MCSCHKRRERKQRAGSYRRRLRRPTDERKRMVCRVRRLPGSVEYSPGRNWCMNARLVIKALFRRRSPGQHHLFVARAFYSPPGLSAGRPLGVAEPPSDSPGTVLLVADITPASSVRIGGRCSPKTKLTISTNIDTLTFDLAAQAPARPLLPLRYGARAGARMAEGP